MLNEYIFYITFGTIPALYAETKIFLDKAPSYLFVRSKGNFDSKVVQNLEYVKSYYEFSGTDIDYICNQYHVIYQEIRKIKKNDNNAKFIVYIDDSRVQYMLKPFLKANALEDIKKIVMISEGNISEQMFSNLNEDDEEKTAKKWSDLICDYNNDDKLVKIDNYAFWLSTQKNVYYYLPYYKLLNNKNISIEYKNKMNLYNLDIEKLYNKLNKNQKKYIYKNLDLKIDKAKKYLIIIGTYDFGSKELTDIVYQNLIDQATNDYKDYKILYKAHPLFPVEKNQNFNEYLLDKNIEILPNKLPLEIVLWENKNIMVGGFASSINSLIEPSRTKFFFGDMIGYAKILYKNSRLKPKSYNVIVSQTLASNLIKYNILKKSVVNELMKKTIYYKKNMKCCSWN